jgi:hypothetical protein
MRVRTKFYTFAWVAFVLGALMPAKGEANGDYPPQPTHADFEAADTGFRYKDQMINPRLVELFEGWISDSGLPVVTAADIAAAYKTNEFYDEEVYYEKTGAGYLENVGDGIEPRYIYYTWMGRLPNGLHVVDFISSGAGGTLVSETIFLFRFSSAKAWRPNPQSAYRSDSPAAANDHLSPQAQYARLLMSLEGYYIPEVFPADIMIKGDTLYLTMSDNDTKIVHVIDTDNPN